jgi:hypothetical protein
MAYGMKLLKIFRRLRNKIALYLYSGKVKRFEIDKISKKKSRGGEI